MGFTNFPNGVTSFGIPLPGWLPMPQQNRSALVVGPNRDYSTIQAAVDAANAGDLILVTSKYDNTGYVETVTVNKVDLTIVGVGPRGSVFIAPTAAGAEGMQVTAPGVTLVNIGVASDDTGDYALNVHGTIAVHADGNRRFRAYGCKFEGGSGASSVCVLLDGDADDNVGDVIFEDCEFCWAARGIRANDSGFGVPTQIVVRKCWFHNITAACIDEVDAGAWYTNLIVHDCVFDSDEAGVEPTDWVVVDHANSSGIFTNNSFATATNATGVLTIGAQIMWVANRTEAGVSTARPA